MRSSPFPLDQIKIASPCQASWHEMQGDEHVRFCSECRRNVYNLSALNRQDAEDLIKDHEGELCVRFYRRADGTLLTADCPVGVCAALGRAAWSAGWAVLALGTGILALLGVLYHACMPPLYQSPGEAKQAHAEPGLLKVLLEWLGGPAPPQPPVHSMGKPCMPEKGQQLQIDRDADHS